MKDKNKIIIFVITLILFFMMYFFHKNIIMFGDDYWYYTYHQLGFIKCIISTYNLFLNTNGRLFINILLGLSFYLNMDIWRIFNSEFICILLLVLNKLFNKKNNVWSYLLIIGLFLSMNVFLSRETVYCHNISFNYLIPDTLIFVSLLLYKNNINNKLLYLFVFLTSFLVEQSAIGCGIIFFFYLVYNYILNKKIDKKCLICFGLACIAFLFMYFSPGTHARIDDEIEAVNIIFMLNNIKEIIMHLCVKHTFRLFNLVFVLLLGIYFFKNKFNLFYKLGFVCLFNIFFLLLLEYDFNFYFVCISYLIYFLFLTKVVIDIYKKNQNDIFICSYVLGYLCLIPLIFSSIVNYRLFFTTYLSFIIVLVFLVDSILDKRLIKYLFVFFIMIIGLFVFGNQYYRYHENLYYYNLNEEIILKEKSNGFINDKMILYKPKNKMYRWILPYDGRFQMNYFRKYYNIPDNITIRFVDYLKYTE